MSLAADHYTFIHSAWMNGAQWAHVCNILSGAGAAVDAPDLPGHGQDKTPLNDITLQAYVDCISGILDKRDAPTILVGHSFGGVVASQVAQERSEKVKAIVYLCAFMLPDGVSFNDVMQDVSDSEVLNNLVFNTEKDLVGIREEALYQAVGADVPEKAFNAAKPSLVLEPTRPLGEKLQLTMPRYGSIPRYYIRCTEDRAIPLAVQETMIKNMPVENAYSLQSSHLPVFSQPEKVAEILQDIAARERLRTDVIAASQGWQQAFNQGDAHGAAGFYEAEAVMHARPFGTYTGGQAILDFWAELIAGGAKDIRYIEPKLMVLDTERATIASRWSMNIAEGVIHKELWARQEDGRVLLREDDFEVLNDKTVA